MKTEQCSRHLFLKSLYCYQVGSSETLNHGHLEGKDKSLETAETDQEASEQNIYTPPLAAGSAGRLCIEGLRALLIGMGGRAPGSPGV